MGEHQWGTTLIDAKPGGFVARFDAGKHPDRLFFAIDGAAK
ncbi:MAG: hypothetical protein ACJ8GW_03505 [Massilia sp.]